MRTLYRAKRVHTFGFPVSGEWILVDERHVQRVGAGDPPPADRVVDLPGATIVPGFIDSHVHLTGTGLAIGDADIEHSTSAIAMLEVVRNRIAEGHVGPLLAGGFDETRWSDPRMPTRADLDALGPDPVVITRADGHLSLANHAAIEAADLSGHAGLERDAGGEPTGRVTQEANARLRRWGSLARTDRELQELQLLAAASAAARGITTVHEMSMPHERGLRDLEVFLAHRTRLPVDSTVLVATTDIPQVMDLRLPSVGGDLPVDGSIGARTAALEAPYADADDAGACYFTPEELVGFFQAGHAAGLQVGMHAIGDRGIEQVIVAWELVYDSLDSRGKRHFRARRHRVEHFEMPSSDQVERAAMLGLAVSVQPAFDRQWGGSGGLYETSLGPERAAAMNPFRWMLDRGMELGAGSDSPITPLDPMAGIAAFERHHDPAQRLTRAEALRAWTIGSARIAHLEEKKGALQPGMHADLAAYELDPTEVDDVEQLRPILTVSLGRDVFAS